MPPPIILLHSSKTMQTTRPSVSSPRLPIFYSEATELATFLRSRSPSDLQAMMHISPSLAVQTAQLYDAWCEEETPGTEAIFSFRGDIYSGLQVHSFSEEDLIYADQSLRLLSGLYGIIRPLDIIRPYRLEMGYHLTDFREPSLYRYWGDHIAGTLERDTIIFNLSSKEYDKVVVPFVEPDRLITPQFFTKQKNGEYGFTAVHAKIARGAFARWLIQYRISQVAELKEFSDLGYRYDATRSTPLSPVFLCDEFLGLGLSVRLS